MSNASDFDIVRMEFGGHPVIFLYGELDLMTAPRVHEGLSEIIKERPSVVLIDMANVRFIDSSGLSALVVAHRHLGEQGGTLRLVSVPPRVAQVFEIAGLHERFHIFENLDAATTPSSP